MIYIAGGVESSGGREPWHLLFQRGSSILRVIKAKEIHIMANCMMNAYALAARAVESARVSFSAASIMQGESPNRFCP